MYKLIISSFFILSLTSILQADNKSYSFLGAKTSLSKYGETSTQSYGLKYGNQVDMWRTALSIGYAKKKEETFQTLILQVDHGILSQTFQAFPLKPFIGFSTGLIQDDNNQQKDKGYLFGLNGGFTYILNNHIDIDLAYRNMTTSKMNSVDSLSDIILSVHYFY